MIDEDERPVTRTVLKIELESLRNRIEFERLERQRKSLYFWQVAFAILIWTTIIAMTISSLVSRGIH
jgi:hypothetical protein